MTQIHMTKDLTLAWCEICEALTPLVLVECIDHALEESWAEEQCRYCFDDSLSWDERY